MVAGAVVAGANDVCSLTAKIAAFLLRVSRDRRQRVRGVGIEELLAAVELA